MHVSEAVDEYLYTLRTRSAHTRHGAKVVLRPFAAWCREHSIELEHIKQGEIRRYTDYLYTRAARTLTQRTIHTYLVRVKAFLRWCSKEEEFEDLISEKVAKRVDLPRYYVAF
jgi:site-specific recombinase XerD